MQYGPTGLSLERARTPGIMGSIQLLGLQVTESQIAAKKMDLLP